MAGGRLDRCPGYKFAPVLLYSKFFLAFSRGEDDNRTRRSRSSWAMAKETARLWLVPTNLTAPLEEHSPNNYTPPNLAIIQY